MANNDAPALALVIGGGVFIYAAVTHKRVIDVLLMRPSTLPASTNPYTATEPNTSGALGGGGSTTSEPAGEYSTVREAIVGAAEQACVEPVGTYEYDEVRPYPSSLFSGPTPRKTDCSGFGILCYKYAKAPDPNGTGYNGEGYTGSLEARGKATTTPQPGDLCFWSSPDHAAVYLGNGQIAEFGGGSGPVTTTVEAENAYHTSFLGYRSYL